MMADKIYKTKDGPQNAEVGKHNNIIENADVENVEIGKNVTERRNNQDGLKGDFNVDNGKKIWTISCDKREDKVYSYEEAINLTGVGGYTRGLLAVLSLTTMAMACDMFGFAVVVSGSACDFEVDMTQRSILMSMPFVGPIIMSYPWGYISDTQGRRKSLLISMSISFIVSTISVFSSNWIMLAVLKLISTSCCSCAQSVTYTLLGESVSSKVRGPYMLVMTSVLMLSQSFNFLTGYYILNLEFSYAMGSISFVPWRLLVLVLTLPSGISVLWLWFFYESPKFLANAGREDDAVNIMKKIWLRNGCPGGNEYPVTKIILNEAGEARLEKQPLLRSLWEQTAPLFKPPLLLRTLQLYYLTAVLYATNNSFLMWYPFLADAFFSGVQDGGTGGLCSMILSSQNVDNPELSTCSSKLVFLTSVASAGHSISFAIINVIMSKAASRKKFFMLSFLSLSFVSGIIIALTTESISSFIFFLTWMGTGLCIGVLFSYFNDLYPTSYKGMVACLGVMVARASSLAGINILGAYILDYCDYTFYIWTVYVFSGVVLAFFLPPDRPKAA